MVQTRKLSLLAVLLLVGCVTAPLPKDPSITASEAQDVTAVAEGCGLQATPGYIFCRKMEGQPSTDSLVFITPPVKCKKPTCAYIKVFNPKADMVISVNVPQGQTRTDIAWKLLLDRESFALTDRGYWPFIYQISFTDNDGYDHTLIMEGEIRLRVYKKNYLPLSTGQSDPTFAWEFTNNGQSIKITTSGRSFVGPKAP